MRVCVGVCIGVYVLNKYHNREINKTAAAAAFTATATKHTTGLTESQIRFTLRIPDPAVPGHWLLLLLSEWPIILLLHCSLTLIHISLTHYFGLERERPKRVKHYGCFHS